MDVHQLQASPSCHFSSCRAPIVLLSVAVCSHSIHHQIYVATPEGSLMYALVCPQIAAL